MGDPGLLRSCWSSWSGPVSPAGLVGHVSPVSAVGLVGPGVPVGPVIPFSLVGHVSSVGAVGLVGSGGPVGPVLMFINLLCFCVSLFGRLQLQNLSPIFVWSSGVWPVITVVRGLQEVGVVGLL